MPYYPTQRQTLTRRVTILASAAVLVASSFAAGAAVQRIESSLAVEQRCNRTSDAIACVIVLDDTDAVEPIDPPRTSIAAEGPADA